MEGYDLKELEHTSSSLISTPVDPEASMILVGMRGAGKTFIGKLAAAALNRAVTVAVVLLMVPVLGKMM